MFVGFERLRAAREPEKHLLKDVFGVLAAARARVGQPKDHARVPLDDLPDVLRGIHSPTPFAHNTDLGLQKQRTAEAVRKNLYLHHGFLRLEVHPWKLA